MKKVTASLGSGLRSFVKIKPRRVALPTTMAKGKVRANPQLRPWGTKYAVQYQARMPIHGRRRHTGTSPRQKETKTTSLTLDPSRRICRAVGSLFHRDALGEVARLIHVASSQDGDVIGEQLEGNDRHQRGQQFGGRGHEECMVSPPRHLVIATVADRDDAAVTRLYLFHVCHHSIVGAVSWSQRDDRHPLIDKG